MGKCVKIHPKPLGGVVQIPPSKSMSHRSVICASLAEGTSKVSNLIFSDDIHMTLNAMKALGAQIELESDAVVITGMGGVGPLSDDREVEIYCKESGSTLRFMIPIATALGGQKKFTGSGRLVERPLTAYLEILKQQKIEHRYSGVLPLEVNGQLWADKFIVDGGESSQYISGLLMAMPLMTGGKPQIQVEGVLESKDYVALTVDMMAHYGVDVTVKDQQVYTLEYPMSSRSYQARDYFVEGDYSQGAFFLVAGQIGQPVVCKGLSADSKQADRRVVEIIRAMGGELKEVDDDIISSPTQTRGTVIDASQCPDIIPVLCVLAALSEGETRVINGSRLRIKESDRIRSTVTELAKLGANIVETQDGMVIQGCSKLKGGEVDGWNDHRIVMAMAIAAIRCEEPVVITGAQAITKSYPHFFEDLVGLSGKIEILED